MKTWAAAIAAALLLVSVPALAAVDVRGAEAQDTASTLARGQQLPFDTDLSVYVAHAGRWASSSTGLYEEAEIEDHVAVFGPGEKMSDDPETWAAHQINSPTRPPGWVFYAPDASEPMGLHIIISDARNRLGAAEIRDYDTGSLIGTLSANAEGSEIEGSVPITAGTKLLRISLTEKAGGAVLAQVGALTARADKVAMFSKRYSWQPNCGSDHQGQPCVPDIGEPYGDPADASGKETLAVGAGGLREGCAGITDFDNDTANATVAAPRYDLLDKKVVREETAPPPDGASPDALTAIAAALKAARAPYQGGQLITQAVAVPPFSRGKVHWPVALEGECTEMICFPYEERKIDGGPNDEKTYYCGAPFPVGSVWALRAWALGPPEARPISGITQPVTFKLEGNITAPDGLPGPIPGARVTCTRGEAWTTPAPPGGPTAPSAETDANGECTLQLQKGYEWTATAHTQGQSPWGTGTAGPFRIPGITGEVTITCPLIVLISLKVQTSNEEGKATAAEVQLYRVTDQGDQWAGGGQSVIGLTGKAIWETNCVPPGNYKVKARVGGGDWSEVAFAASIGVEFVVPVEV